MVLFPDEKTVTISNDNSVTLTTHRICSEQKSFQTSGTKNIMLEHITSCESLTKKYYIFIGIAAIGIFILLGADSEVKILGGILGMIGTAAYFLTKSIFSLLASAW